MNYPKNVMRIVEVGAHVYELHFVPKGFGQRIMLCCTFIGMAWRMLFRRYGGKLVLKFSGPDTRDLDR